MASKIRSTIFTSRCVLPLLIIFKFLLTLLGALFVYGAEIVMNHIGVENPVELMKKDRFVDDPTSSMSVTVEVKCQRS